MFAEYHDPTIEDSYMQNKEIDGQWCILDGKMILLFIFQLYPSVVVFSGSCEMHFSICIRFGQVLPSRLIPLDVASAICGSFVFEA